MRRLSAPIQDRFADLILHCPDKRYYDEVCFQVAHLAPAAVIKRGGIAAAQCGFDGCALAHGCFKRFLEGFVGGLGFSVFLGHVFAQLLVLVFLLLLREVFGRWPAGRDNYDDYQHQHDHTHNDADDHARVAALFGWPVGRTFLRVLHLFARATRRSGASRAACWPTGWHWTACGRAARRLTCARAFAGRAWRRCGCTDLNHVAALRALKLNASLKTRAVVFHAAGFTSDSAHELPRLTTG